ncbi:MAG: helix-turn-helix domain-containing protein, partial [Chloroflexota bacterium]|nr:helix-turn-helix domain-containing protein [Chloroflexota bacterium]
ETVGAVIRRERQERGLTIRELAERAIVSPVYLGEIERGQKYPSALVVERVAEALDLDVPAFIDLVVSDLRVEATVEVARAQASVIDLRLRHCSDERPLVVIPALRPALKGSESVQLSLGTRSGARCCCSQR